MAVARRIGRRPASFWTGVVTALQGRARRRRRDASSCSRRTRLRPTWCSPRCSTSSPRRRARCGWCSTTTTWSTGPRSAGHDLPARAPAAARPPRAQHPGRPRPAAGPVAGARRAGRGPRRRPALHLRARPRPTSTTATGAATSPPSDVRPWRSGPRAGSPRSSSPPSRCRAATDVGGFIARFAGERPVHRRLPRRGGAGATSPSRCATSCCSTAVLDRLTGPLCDAVTGRDDGSAACSRPWSAPTCSSSPLDDRREWYRYHHLFADVLRARLLAEQPDLVPLLHQRASRWYERHDLTEDGGPARPGRAGLRPGGVPDRAGRAGDPAPPAGGDAARLAAGTARRRRRGAARCSASSTATCSWSPATSTRFEARLDDAERALAAVPDGAAPPWADTEELRTLPATIAIYRASLAQARGDVGGHGAPRPARPRPGRPRRPSRAGRRGRVPRARRMGATATCRRRWRRSRRRWRACTRPATSSTS